MSFMNEEIKTKSSAVVLYFYFFLFIGLKTAKVQALKTAELVTEKTYVYTDQVRAFEMNDKLVGAYI